MGGGGESGENSSAMSKANTMLRSNMGATPTKEVAM